MAIDITRVAFAVLSSSSFGALCAYIFLAARGRSKLLYATGDTRIKLPVLAKVFFALAGIGLLLCLFSGAQAMLSWISDRFGPVKLDEGPKPIIFTLSMLFTAYGGISLIGFIDQATHDKFDLNQMAEYCRGQDKIIDACATPEYLAHVRQEFVAKIEAIQSDLLKRETLSGWEEISYLPDRHRMQIYRKLIFKIDQISKR